MKENKPLAARFGVVHVSSTVLVERVVREMHEHVGRIICVRVRVTTRRKPKKILKD